MSNVLEAGVAIYVAMAVALAVWIGLFVYLWRLDAQAQALKKLLQQEPERGEQPRGQDLIAAAPRATVTRVEK